MTHIKKIIEADDFVEVAQFRLTRTIASEFPIGCSISVTLGNASIVATVLAYGTNHREREMLVKNQRTGKERRFNVVYSNATRLGV